MYNQSSSQKAPLVSGKKAMLWGKKNRHAKLGVVRLYEIKPKSNAYETAKRSQNTVQL